MEEYKTNENIRQFFNMHEGIMKKVQEFYFQEMTCCPIFPINFVKKSTLKNK